MGHVDSAYLQRNGWEPDEKSPLDFRVGDRSKAHLHMRCEDRGNDPVIVAIYLRDGQQRLCEVYSEKTGWRHRGVHYLLSTPVLSENRAAYAAALFAAKVNMESVHE